MRRLALPCLLLCVLKAQIEVPKENPYTSPADIERGKHLFSLSCAQCHGPAGAGGRGANLARPKLPRAFDDQALFTTIRDGIPRTEMPGAWSLNDHEIWQVAAFVRTLGRVPQEKVPGDVAAGRALFRAQGCLRCHIVETEGGRMGPPLTEVGLRRGANYLRTKLLEPASALTEDFTVADLTAGGGERVSGIVLNEDTYSIQIRDLSGKLHSYWKRDLAALEKRTDRTPMPSYRGRLSDEEMQNLIAYLASLRGAP